MRLLVTGCAGFIGSKTCELLLDEGNEIVGVDSLNDAYDPKLKHWRLSRLKERDGFTMLQLNIDDASALAAIPKPDALDAVVNLAARAGVRPSVEMPSVYYQTNVLGTLNYREREIIRLRFGLADGYSYTLEEVGKIFSVTRERVRQIEAKAVRKLQHPVRAATLAGFMDDTDPGESA